MKFTKLIAELGAIDLVSGWLVFSEMHHLSTVAEIGIKLAVAASVIIYNVVKTREVLKKKK